MVVQSPEMLALVVLTFFVAGIVKGTVGLGLPIVVLVFLAVPLGITQAISLMLIPGIATNLFQALIGPDFRGLVRRLGTYLIACIIGIWFGVNLLEVVSQDTALAALGIMLAIYSGISLRSPQIRPPGKYEPILSPLAGGTGGIIFGVTGTFIVPGILYLQALGLKKNELVQALGITFITLNITLLSAFLTKDFIPPANIALSFACIIPTAIGLWIGQRLRHRVSEEAFRAVFFWALLVTGFYFIWAGS
jgi:uncharacterized membrane protein YfcA